MSDSAAVTVRSASALDRSAVLALVPRLAETGTPVGRNRGKVQAADLRSLAGAFDTPRDGTMLLVAEVDGRVAGFIHAFPVQDYYTATATAIVHVADVVVAREAEGHGIGRRLMDAVERHAIDAGYRMIQLYVLPENAPARALYERAGYRPEWIKYVRPLDVD